MSNTLHFWPQDIVSSLPASPVTVLREAATELGEATKGAVEAEVGVVDSGVQMVYGFFLVAKALGFRFRLLNAGFSSRAMYPCTIFFEGEAFEAQDEDEMRQRLASVLQSRTAVMAVKSLAAQALAA